MAEKEQLKPPPDTKAAPPATTLHPSSADEEPTFYIKKTGRKKLIKCCGGAVALLLVETVFLIILIFTVLKVKGPVIKMNGVKFDKLELITSAATSPPGSFSNMSLTAHVLVKNPSLSSFNYGTTNMTLYYRTVVIGEATGPPGKAKARSAMQMNVTVDIMTDRLISSPYLEGDVKSGMVEVNGVARVGARMKMLNIFKKHVVVKMNCSIFINITSQSVQKHKCRRKVKL